ncbi:VOC family protein [Rhodovulum sp. DZ06]|uniref:VOC family protein n=1 Tax=Rhodovulum sp. DZ06 TaxID=3425126 RepID=UPI003D345839
MTLELDHIVLGSLDLDRDGKALEARFGVPAQGGGAHPGMGSRNLLWGLGPVYLELIGPDPAQEAPAVGLPFGLSTPATRARLADGPAPVAWVLRARKGVGLGAVEAAATLCPAPIGPLTPMSRGDLSWRLTIPGDRIPACGGVVPSLIDWPMGGCPPAQAMAGGPMRLSRLLRRADPAAEAALAALGADALAPEGETDGGPLRVVLDTPMGPVAFG